MTTYEFILVNESGNTEDFYLFQEPAEYSTTGQKVFTNSIYRTTLRSGSSQDVITLQQQFMAGTQEAKKEIVEGQPSGSKGDAKNIELTPATGEATNNAVDVLLDPLGLGDVKSDEKVKKGAFRILVPIFNPATTHINVGLATKCNEEIVLSNFVKAKPDRCVDCQPVVTFYFHVGAYKAGTVINFTESSRTAGVCDTSKGHTRFKIVFTDRGQWEITQMNVASFLQLKEDLQSEV